MKHIHTLLWQSYDGYCRSYLNPFDCIPDHHEMYSIWIVSVETAWAMVVTRWDEWQSAA